MSGEVIATCPSLGDVTLPTSTETAIASTVGGSTRALLTPYRNNVNPQGVIDGRLVRIKFTVLFRAGVTSTAVIKLYQDSNANTNLTTFTGDVAACATTANNFSITASGNTAVHMYTDMVYETISQQAVGFFSWIVSDGSAAQTRPILMTGLSITSVAAMGFFVTVTLGTGNAVSKAILREFSMERY